MNRKFIYLKLFCNIIKVFALTFDQFNALLLNKSITPPKKTKNYFEWQCIDGFLEW